MGTGISNRLAKLGGQRSNPSHQPSASLALFFKPRAICASKALCPVRHTQLKTVLENPYIFHEPTPKQAKFLMLPHREALFGGAAGGGKSDALLMSALQYVSEPGYSALILHKSYKHLAQPGAIMDRMKQWHATWTRELGLDATWNENDKAMTFPSGARILFGHIAYENEKDNYLGAEYQHPTPRDTPSSPIMSRSPWRGREPLDSMQAAARAQGVGGRTQKGGGLPGSHGGILGQLPRPPHELRRERPSRRTALRK